MKLFDSALVLAVALGVVAAVSGCVPTMSKPVEYADRPISKEAGAEYFLRTGGGDPYATGMAYPVFLALMEDFPEELGKDWNEFADKFGFIPDPDAKGDPHAPPLGLHLTTDPNTEVPWLVANCQMCHTERVRLTNGDLIVPGLGNKAVRPHAYGNALARIGANPRLDAGRIADIASRKAREWQVTWKKGDAITKITIDAFKKGSIERLPFIKRFDAALPGRMATIESFALVLGAATKQPIPIRSDIGWTKTPDVRSFPYRETFSYDGSGYGSPQALVLEADFLFGTRPEWYLDHPHIATSMYMYLKGFTRDLPYPKAIDQRLAARGKEIFEEQCSQCHGYYVNHGDEKRVSYRERVIPKEKIGTDPTRADAVTPEFVAAANAYPLTRGLTAVRNTGGYIPPVLLDVWARGVFGHAGQWPSLEALGTAPAQRPQRFIVDTTGLYDLDRVGVRYEIVPAGGAPRALKPHEYFYDGTKAGLRVEGHPFLSDLPTEDRRAVIEYVKTI